MVCSGGPRCAYRRRAIHRSGWRDIQHGGNSRHSLSSIKLGEGWFEFMFYLIILILFSFSIIIWSSLGLFLAPSLDHWRLLQLRCLSKQFLAYWDSPNSGHFLQVNEFINLLFDFNPKFSVRFVLGLATLTPFCLLARSIERRYYFFDSRVGTFLRIITATQFYFLYYASRPTSYTYAMILCEYI